MIATDSETAAYHNLMESGLLEKLGEPATVENLTYLLSHLDLIRMAVQMADELVRRSEELTDNLGAALVDARKTASAFPFAELPRLTDALSQLTRSGIFDPKTVSVLAEVGTHASEAYKRNKLNNPPPVGPFALLKALSDPDVQRSVGFLVGMAKEYGQMIR